MRKELYRLEGKRPPLGNPGRVIVTGDDGLLTIAVRQNGAPREAGESATVTEGEGVKMALAILDFFKPSAEAPVPAGEPDPLAPAAGEPAAAAAVHEPA